MGKMLGNKFLAEPVAVCPSNIHSVECTEKWLKLDTSVIQWALLKYLWPDLLYLH